MTAVRLPIRLGDLSGPGGNAFAIFGSIKNCARQVGTPQAHGEAARLVAKFMQGTYEEGLQMLREEADWLDDDGPPDDEDDDSWGQEDERL